MSTQAELYTFKKISDLTELPELESKLMFLITDEGSAGAYKNYKTRYSTISNDLVTAALTNANNYTDSICTFLSVDVQNYKNYANNLFSNIGTRINSASAYALEKANEQADLFDSSLRSLLLTIIRDTSSDVNSNAWVSVFNLSDALCSDVKNLSTALSTDIITLSTNLSNDIAMITSTQGGDFSLILNRLNLLETNTSTATDLGNKFTLIDNSINDINSKTATNTSLGMIKIGYANNIVDNKYGVLLTNDKQAFVHVPNNGGSSIPDNYNDVANYTLNVLSAKFGRGATNYESDKNILSANIDDIKQYFLYFDNTYGVTTQYNVVRLNANYAAGGEDKFYVATNDDADLDAEGIYSSVIEPGVAYKKLVESTTTYITKLEFKDDDNTYIYQVPGDDVTWHRVDFKQEYETLVKDSDHNIIYVVASNKKPIEPQIFNALKVYQSSIDTTKYVAYDSIIYSLAKAAVDIATLRNDIFRMVEEYLDEGAMDDIIGKTIEVMIDQLNKEYSTSNDNTITIGPSTTGTIAIYVPPTIEVRDEVEHETYQYKPISIKTVNVSTANVEITNATMFNNYARITLYNSNAIPDEGSTETGDITVNANEVTVVINCFLNGLIG